MNNNIVIYFSVSVVCVFVCFHFILKLYKRVKLLESVIKKFQHLKRDKDSLQYSFDQLNNWKKDIEKKIPKWKSCEKIVADNANLKQQNKDILSEIKGREKDLSVLKQELGSLREYKELEESGVFNFKFNFQEVEQYEDAFKIIKEYERQLVKSDMAFITHAKDLVGSPIMKSLSKLSLLAFNGTTELITSNIRFNNYDSCLEKVEKAFKKVNDLLAPFNSEISVKYHELKIKELALGLEYEEEKQRIKDEQDEIRRQMKEELKIIEEAEKAVDKAVEEEDRLEIALEVARKEVEGKNAAERAEFEQKILDLETKLEKAHENSERAISNAQLTSRGHVYIISNIGSFGENVYKIGMTR